VLCGILETECVELNRRFFTSFEQGRPYVVLKWAQSADGFIAGKNFTTVAISNAVTNRLVHRWRSEEAAILVGTQTALSDNPALSNRHWTGAQPLRLVIDRDLKLSSNARLLDNSLPTCVFNARKDALASNTRFVQLEFGAGSILPRLLGFLHQQHIRSVLVEGGTKLHNSFLEENLWDEARVITATDCILGEGVEAPKMVSGRETESYRLMSDRITHYRNTADVKK
jgi:diaminohydroxyphosphoribosylaminopyrimidine deaminase/5-amino-6-(5-phosphoribosylamino)uracil reductase